MTHLRPPGPPQMRHWRSWLRDASKCRLTWRTIFCLLKVSIFHMAGERFFKVSNGPENSMCNLKKGVFQVFAWPFSFIFYLLAVQKQPGLGRESDVPRLQRVLQIYFFPPLSSHHLPYLHCFTFHFQTVFNSCSVANSSALEMETSGSCKTSAKLQCHTPEDYSIP
jgi:hypothetical protein